MKGNQRLCQINEMTLNEGVKHGVLDSLGSLEPEEKRSEQCLDRHSWEGGCCPLNSTGQTCLNYKKIRVSLDVLKKIRQNPELSCPTTTTFGCRRTKENVSWSRVRWCRYWKIASSTGERSLSKMILNCQFH